VPDSNGDRKTFVLDTNVLLHNPNALFMFADNEVVIPFDCIEELDSFKAGTDDLGRNARTVIRHLDQLRQLGNMANGVPVAQTGGSIRVILEEDQKLCPGLTANTPDNRIILDLTVSDDSVGQVVVASGGVNVPSINTRTVATQVVLGDGQTVVLGGILETNQTRQATKVPWLGDIPVLGALFRSTTDTNDKDELLIFVTPKILREGINVN